MATSEERQAARLLKLWQEAEILLMRELAKAVKLSLWEDVDRLEVRAAAVRKLRKRTSEVLERLGVTSQDMLLRLAKDEYEAAVMSVFNEVGYTAPAAASASTVGVVQAMGAGGAATLMSQRLQVIRTVDDAYRRIISSTVQAATVAGVDQRVAMRSALNRFADRGITSFTDRAGRRWGMDTYADMAIRTMRNQASQEGHLAGYEQAGVELVRASWHPASAPQCFPFQNQLLAISGPAGSRTLVDPATGDNVTVTVKDTLRGAIAKGYHHPNAILGGEHKINTWGKAQAGSKGSYCGPSVTIRTSKFDEVTVSPNHPVLTRRGWIAAQRVRKGDYLFRTCQSGTSPVNIVSTPNFDDMVTTVEEEFSALKERLVVVNTPTAGHNFNDDRKFLKNEVCVVVPDNGLLPVPDAQIVQETGEVFFDWPDMGGADPISCGSQDFCRVTVGGSPSILGPLFDSYPSSFQPAKNGCTGDVEIWGDLLGSETFAVEPNDVLGVNVGARDREIFGKLIYNVRPGDSKDVGEVTNAVPGGAEPVEVTSVVFGFFEGHAYDFHTEDGIYAANNLILHNCRHRDTAYTAGDKKPTQPTVTEEQNAAQYEASQRQRSIERTIRRWRKREAVALTPHDRLLARNKIREWNAAQKQHVNAHPYLSRWRHREQIRD